MAKKSKAAVIEEPDELELIEDDEEETPKASKSKTKAKAAVKEPKAESTNTGMGASWLAEYVNEELGTEYTAANMRVILRKMAKDGDLEREVGTDRARYQFTGEKDPTVRAVLKRARAGEADTAKAERLAAAKSGGKRAKADDDDEEPVKRGKSKSKAAADDDEKPRPAARRRRKADEE
jgi:hypothetical protein